MVAEKKKAFLSPAGDSKKLVLDVYIYIYIESESQREREMRAAAEFLHLCRIWDPCLCELIWDLNGTCGRIWDPCLCELIRDVNEICGRIWGPCFCELMWHCNGTCAVVEYGIHVCAN